MTSETNSKLDQIRALREAMASSRSGVESSGTARDTHQVTSGDTRRLQAPGAGVAPGLREAKFDRLAYQREYMRGWRAKQKEKTG